MVIKIKYNSYKPFISLQYMLKNRYIDNLYIMINGNQISYLYIYKYESN
jgi:hypothetical protein